MDVIDIINKRFKLVMFDMDGTLIDGRSIFIFSEKIGFKDRLIDELKKNSQPFEKSIEIAKFLKGINRADLLEIFREIPLNKHVDKVARVLNEKKIKTAIVTDSYQFIAEDLRKRLNFDFAFANNLIIKQDIVTGEIKINNENLLRCDGGIIYSICKDLILEHLCRMLNIKPYEVIAVGDGVVDIGMIKRAGLGIAFNSSEEVSKNADIATDNFEVILDYI